MSAIIPAFRCAQYIAQAIDSVLSQSYPHHEIIVVNDGSPDTPLLEQALAPYRHRISYIEQENMGPAGARNTAIRQSCGKYLAFLDADDYWGDDHLLQQMALFRNDPTLDLVYRNYMVLKDEKPLARSFDIQPQTPEVNFDSLLTEDCAIGTSTAVCSREFIIRAGLFDATLMRCEDFEMWLRMSLCGARMAYRSEVQVFHRINEAGLSADNLSMKRDRIRVYQKLATNFSVSRQEQEIIHELIARTEADCQLDMLKQALEKGDYANAFTAASNARAKINTWKLRASLFGLRMMPSLLRRIYLARSFFYRNGKFSGPTANDSGPGLDGNSPKDRKGEPLVGSVPRDN